MFWNLIEGTSSNQELLFEVSTRVTVEGWERINNESFTVAGTRCGLKATVPVLQP